MDYPTLPQHDPHPDLWNRIKTELDNDRTLARAIAELPQHEPDTDLWTRIDGVLFADQPTAAVRVLPTETVRKLPVWDHWRWAGWAAAACVLLAGSWLLTRSESSAGRERIEYTVERQTDPPVTKIYVPVSNATDAAIARLCARRTVACQQPGVHALRNQLHELTAEQQRLTREQQTFGNDPALARARQRVDDQRADVANELITLLQS
jgi:hypothetical protein